jgi:outer membrane lipoprotein-sorting protein
MIYTWRSILIGKPVNCFREKRMIPRTLSLLVVCVASGLLLSVSPSRAQSSGASPEQSNKPAEQAFKNIQVLKGTPSNEVVPAMQFIANSLGVECQFCHVQGAFEKDDKKPKQTARKMIEMQMAINRDNFKGEQEVTCFSCHRGSENPVGVPIIPDEPTLVAEKKEAEGGTGAALPSADEIINKYIEALGGAPAIEKINSRVEKGTINVNGHDLPVEVTSKAPNKRISIVHTPNGENVTAYDGQSGWIGNPGPRPPRTMSPQEAEIAAFEANFHLPLELKKMFSQLRVRPSDKIGGREAVQVVGMNQGKPPVRLFFDKESGLLLRAIHYTETPLGRNPTEVNYSDYRAEQGVKVPLQWTVARPLGRFTIQIKSVEQNVPVEDSKFEKPAAPSNTEGKQ